MSNTELRGTGVAIVTPFRDGSVDYASLERVVEHCIQGGVEYLVAMGSTGESLTLSDTEKVKVLETVIRCADQRVPIWTGHLAGSNTQAILSSLDSFGPAGLKGLMISTPAYNKPNPQGLMEHYKRINDSTSLPILMYNIPSRTAVNMTADVCLQLSEDCDNIVGVKEASGDFSQVNEILRHKPSDFHVISGDDPTAIGMIAFGGSGLVSVIANAFPQKTSDMVRAALAGDFDQARTKHGELWDYYGPLYAEGNPTGIKALMALLGICGPELRLPLIEASDAVQDELRQLIKS